MNFAEETISKLNDLIGEEGCPLYAIITVGDTAHVVSAHLNRFEHIPGDVKFRIQVRATFNDKEYIKMTELYDAMVLLGKKMYDTDLSSKNFDWWGRFHVILPREGKWCSTTVRGLMSSSTIKSRLIRQGKERFDPSEITFRPAREIYEHLRSNDRPIFTLTSAPTSTSIAAMSRKRKIKINENTEALLPTNNEERQLYDVPLSWKKKLNDLHMAFIVLNNASQKGTLEEDAIKVVEKYPNTALLSDLLSIEQSEAEALMQFAQSKGKKWMTV
jgi:hypothetical protein